MVDILDEARESFEQEQLLALLKKYGAVIILGTILVIIGIIGWQFWKGHEKKEQETASIAYFDAIDKLQAGDKKGGEEALVDLIKTAPKGYKTLAQLQLAAMKLETGKTQEAIAYYQEVEKSGSAEFRDLASLLSAELNNKAPEKTDGAWKYSALELEGLQYLKAKNYAKAKESFTKISTDPYTPSGLRQRAADFIIYATYLEENKK